MTFLSNALFGFSLFIFCLHGLVDCVTLLPFGASNPDDVAAPGLTDDSVSQITATVPLAFYGNSYSSLWLGSNGYIGFQDTVAFDNHIPSPLNLKLISPLFDDLTPVPGGVLYYRQSSSTVDRLTTSALIDDLYPEVSPYAATYVLVATWSDYKKSGQSVLLTFQAIVATNGASTYAVFLYQQLPDGLTADVGIDAGDGTNFYKLCIGNTAAIRQLPQLKQTCTGEEGVFGFRIDTVNPDQGSYMCTDISMETDCGCAELADPQNGAVDTSAGRLEGDIATYSCQGGYDLVGDATRVCLPNNTWDGSEPSCQIIASYYCVWTDSSHTTVDVIFIINLPNAKGIMAWDTQKYEDGENPNLNDASCETDYTSDPTAFTFTVNPDAVAPGCGVRATGLSVKLLEVTVRVHHGGDRFDLAEDKIYQFTCTTDTLLPRTQLQTKQFSDIEITSLPVPTRSILLQVIAPDSDEVLTQVRTGQLIKLRVIYDNTANNVEPYKLHIMECTVADTANFDSSTVYLIQSGCVVAQTPGAVWYMSRSFQQTSLSATGLFITDSGTFVANRFINKDKLFFGCVVQFCFFSLAAPNLCTDSCPIPGRRKRNGFEENPQTVYTSIKLLSPEGSESPERQEKNCIDSVIVYTLIGSIGFLQLLVLIFTCFLFWNIIHLRTKLRHHYR